MLLLRRRATLILSLALIAAAAFIVAAPLRKPMREQMLLDDRPVVVDYKTAATAKDLGLPFYGDAMVGDSFSYRVTTTEGKFVTSYASALLTTTDPAERVSQYYSDKLPGNPKAELLTDKPGRRYVLALASDKEVRRVTITPEPAGCRIELVRAFGKTIPQQPLKPSGKGQRIA
jgi:hypothetical protein